MKLFKTQNIDSRKYLPQQVVRTRHPEEKVRGKKGTLYVNLYIRSPLLTLIDTITIEIVPIQNVDYKMIWYSVCFIFPASRHNVRTGGVRRRVASRGFGFSSITTRPPAQLPPYMPMSPKVKYFVLSSNFIKSSIHHHKTFYDKESQCLHESELRNYAYFSAYKQHLFYQYGSMTS